MWEENWKNQALLFLISQNFSIFGSSLVGFTIIWYITLKTSSGGWVTLATMSTLLPPVFLSMWAGVLADRYNRKWIIMLSDGLTAMVTLAAFFLFCAGMESVSLLIALSFLRSSFGAFQSPAVNALYPQIVPEEHLVRISGINQTLNHTFLLISPAVGGILLGTLGIQWSFLADVLTAFFALAVMSWMKVSGPREKYTRSRKKKQAERSDQEGIFSEREDIEAENGKETTVMEELRAGLGYAWHHPLLRIILIGYAVTFILFTPLSRLSPLMISRTFGEEVWRLTANEMFWTAGSLAGGAIIALRGEIKNKYAGIFVTITVMGILILLMGLAPYFWLFLFFDCLCGMLIPPMMASQTYLIQTNTDPRYMGRVFSLMQIVSMGMVPMAMLFFGPLGDYVKIQLLLIVTGGLMAVWGQWNYHKMMRYCRQQKGK